MFFSGITLYGKDFQTFVNWLGQSSVFQDQQWRMKGYSPLQVFYKKLSLILIVLQGLKNFYSYLINYILQGSSALKEEIA